MDAFTPSLLNRLPEPPRKVAILRASRIGDFICALPAFRALRAALPAAEITILTLPILRDLALRSPFFDRFAAFPGFPGLAEQFFDARRALHFFQEMQAESFDLAIQMQGSGVYSNPFTLMLGAKATAGYVRAGEPAGLLDAALPLPDQGHEIDRALALAVFLGAESQGEETIFPLWPEDHSEAETLLAGLPRPWIGIHPSARQLTRRWPVDRFAEVGQALLKEWGGSLILIGEAEERETAESILCRAGGGGVNLSGRTSLGTLGAVIGRLALLVTNDSGPAHIAYASGTPTVTIFGGGDVKRYCAPHLGPFRMLAYPVPCRPCDYAQCPIGYLCLENITPGQVIQAAQQIIRI